MRVPIEWLREYAPIPADVSPRAIADALVRAGLEVESVDVVGEGLTGPLLVGRVVQIDELTEFKKPIRFCQVDVGEAQPRGIICGATNFAEGDLVAVALPGAVLPGNFAITARKTYGHVSDGMICSARELGLGDDHDGILVLDSGQPGDDAAELLGVGAAVLDIAVTPDRGYCLSIRGVAREAATAFALEFVDPADSEVPNLADGSAGGDGRVQGVRIEDPVGCPQYIAVRIAGFDPSAATPTWMAQRLVACGMRPISLAVDITNYLMLELGQPLHAFDAAKLSGDIVVRRAAPAERLVTLDHVDRALDGEDLLIADESVPIGLAGTMGGLDSEISETTDTIVLESAAFAPEVVARMARRHKLPSEASRRFERGVDPRVAWSAARRAAALLTELGGGTVTGLAHVGEAPPLPTITMAVDLPARIAGATGDVPGTAVITPEIAQANLEAVGAMVAVDSSSVDPRTGIPSRWEVTVPSWRPDLRDQADLVEEVVRLFGYENLPATMPSPPAGPGLTREQRQRRSVSRALAHAGLVETPCYPFVGQAEVDALGIVDERARMVALANPLSEEAGLLRTTMLPGLVAAARRNFSRGAEGVALFETGAVFHPRGGEADDESQATRAQSTYPRPSVSGRPSNDELQVLESTLPEQPIHVAALLAGEGVRDGVVHEWGWQDAIIAAQVVAEALNLTVELQSESDRMPWHPGRCARLVIDGTTVGFAGELHPRVVASTGLPARSAAMELNLDLATAAALDAVTAPSVSTFPVAKEDVALVVDEEVPAAHVAQALRDGGGPLLESVRLFDEYRGSQIPEGRKSLAFALRLRAPDRTLSDVEVAEVRQSAVAAAAERFDAVLRSG